MSMTELNLSFPTEKLDALLFCMDKKQSVERRMEPVAAPRQESPAPARECPAHQPRRPRQAASEAALVPEAPPEPEGPDEQDGQGMTLNM